MAISIEKPKTALLVMDMENDIVHEEGAFKDFGIADTTLVTELDFLVRDHLLIADGASYLITNQAQHLLTTDLVLSEELSLLVLVQYAFRNKAYEFVLTFASSEEYANKLRQRGGNTQDG